MWDTVVQYVNERQNDKEGKKAEDDRDIWINSLYCKWKDVLGRIGGILSISMFRYAMGGAFDIPLSGQQSCEEI